MARKKNGTVKLVVILGIAVTASLVSTFVFKTKMDEYKAASEGYEDELESNQRTVYVAIGNLEKGTVLALEQVDEDGNVVAEANIESRTVYSSLASDSFINEEDLGKRCVVDINADDPVMKSMVAEKEITNSLREYEISTAKLMNTQKEGDYIDLRVTYPDGEAAVVLAKKEIVKMPDGTSYFTTHMNEDEILNYVSAMLDSFLVPGTSLYTTSYIEPNIQDAAIVTYVPRVETLALLIKDDLKGIQNNLNVEKGISVDEYNMLVQARNGLMSYLTTLSEDQMEALNSALETNNAGVSVLDGSGAALDLSQIDISEADNVTDEALVESEEGDAEKDTEDTIEGEDTEESNVTVTSTNTKTGDTE